MIGADDLLLADRTDRARLTLSGPDRAKFLHNYCTHDIKKLAPGRGLEAFVTSPQGRTLGFFTVHARPDSLFLRADPGGLDAVLPHFAKYGVFDDVAWQDETEATFEMHLAGDRSHDWLASRDLPIPECDLEVAEGTGGLVIVRESPLGLTGYTLISPRAKRDEILGSARDAGAIELSLEEIDGLRIEAGTPRFGADVTTENLPQEISRDRRAISFVKGCYLGQETVARLDALGHVNRWLRKVEILAGGPPPVGAALKVGDVPAGIITSSGISRRSGRPVALAMIRVKAAPDGFAVTWEAGSGRVVAPSEG